VATSSRSFGNGRRCLIPKLSDERRSFLWTAATKYRHAMPGSPAADLLAARDLVGGAEKFGLGYVREPMPGHEQYRGRLAIPYLRWAPQRGHSVVAMRFRCAELGCSCSGHAKYLSEPGSPATLFNAPALLEEHDAIAITEGELDAISAEVSGVPAVGVPGVDAWETYWRVLFLGYESVPILTDNDRPQYRKDCPKCRNECRGHNPGMEFATKVAKDLPNARILPWEQGEDTNSTMVAHGRGFILRKVKGDA
jgi:hypothetical protein